MTNNDERVDLSLHYYYSIEGAVMSKSYQQLTEEERTEIHALKREEKSERIKGVQRIKGVRYLFRRKMVAVQ